MMLRGVSAFADRGGNSMALVDRVKNILLSPQTEWPTIASEASSVQSILTGYVLILAAIGPIALAIRFMGLGILTAAVTYVMGILILFVIAWIVDMLAPTFGGEKNFIQSFKLVAYSSTASWIAGIFKLLPFLGGLVALVALVYTLYTFYLGAPVLKKCAADKAVPYTIVVVVCGIVLGALIGLVLMPMLMVNPMAGLGMMQ
jgi:hypothetical protein